MKYWAVFLGLVLFSSGRVGAAPPIPGADADFRLSMYASALGLDRAAKVDVREDLVTGRSATYEVHTIVLHNRTAGNIHLRVRVPLSAGLHPAVFLAHGVNNADSPFLFQELTDDAELVEFEYPYDGRKQGLSLVGEVVRSAWRSELQMAAALTWLSERHEVDSDHISVVSVSLGTFLTPLAIRLAQVFGFHSYATVFAFGGADLSSLVQTVARGFISQADYRNIEAPLDQVLKIAEPSQHLGHLQGQFLVIKGSLDQVIPAASTDALEQGLPEPKKIVTLDTGHISASNTKLIQQTVKIARDWLASVGALDRR